MVVATQFVCLDLKLEPVPIVGDGSRGPEPDRVGGNVEVGPALTVFCRDGNGAYRVSSGTRAGHLP